MWSQKGQRSYKFAVFGNLEPIMTSQKQTETDLFFVETDGNVTWNHFSKIWSDSEK